ncbi:MAG: signal peptide peptidase SppA, partial [Candidatus Hydrothermarchaeota archaeon]|nr:signal peptide peptidase SppA [Candidatus Hydrothermarchaeota archaeon]
MRKILILLLLLIALVGVSILGAYVITKQDREFAFGDKVALIDIHGTISMSGDSSIFGEVRATPENFKKALKQAERDSSVKAILLDINCPGGSVVASGEIADAIKNCKKPTVAWLGEIAASGGYYVASAADYIVADRATITGSIGVISMFPEYSRLMEKIGVNVSVIKAGKYKDFSTGYRPMTEEEKEMLESVVYEIYEQFINEVAENRNLSKEYVSSIAEGRVYTARKAKELKLVDEVGNRDFALKKAAELGGIEGEPK